MSPRTTPDTRTPSARVRPAVALALALLLSLVGTRGQGQSASVNGHPVVLDGQQKIVTWMTPAATAFDRFLDQRWSFVKTRVPMSPGPAPRSSYPIYYFYNGYVTTSPTIQPDLWMNDVGEKIPNWFESARLYYAYTGDASVMTIAKDLVDYALAHGTSPSTFAWPNFPYTTTNAGDLEFRGFTESGRFALHEIQVDHAAEIGLTHYRMYLYTGDAKYLTAALNAADVLASKARTGTATQSVWPYRVVMSTGQITSQYGANWIGAYSLLDALVRAGIGNVAAYQSARDKARAFILAHPMVTGYWTDGHSDVPVTSNTYKSNMSKSNAALYMLDNPAFDPDWRTHIPQLLAWTETWFVTRRVSGEPATEWGANIVGEQDDFLYKMDYQTARYAAENAKWYAASGDAASREKAFRALSWVTYTNDSNGRATESPYSLNIATWFSDCYGEGPRMFYHAFAGMPELAPPGEDHILYSQGVLRNVSYAPGEVKYTPTDADDTEYLRLTFLPTGVTVGGAALAVRSDLSAEGYTVRSLGGGDYAVNVRRLRPGAVVLAGTPAGLPSLTIDDVQVTEGNGGTTSAVFTVRLSAASGQAVTVDYATADGTATTPADYTTTAAAISFPAGTTTRTITVQVIGDLLDEANETFLVRLSSPAHALLGDAQATGTILDDDPMPVLTIGDVSLAEGEAGTTAAAFSLSLSAPSGRVVRVVAATANGTATAGSDYASGTLALELSPGTVAGTVGVGVLGDRVWEPDETFSVTLSLPLNATLGDAQGTGTILDDDPQGLSVADLDAVEPVSGTRNAFFAVTLAPASASPVSVSYAVTAVTATAGSDFTPVSGSLAFDPGVTILPVSVPILADALAESVESIRLDLSGPTGAAIAYGQATGRIHDPGNLFTVVPCRVVDTRLAQGPYGGPALAAGQSRAFTLAGQCGIPAGAKAVAANVTVTGPTAAGNLRLYPADQALPSTSTLNYVAGQTRANNAIVGLSASGALAVRCAQATGTAHVILDVTGYME
jgi:hypothetical protein